VASAVQKYPGASEDLVDRLDSLGRNCLTDLDAALSAVAAGDLTVEVTPVTTPLTAEAGRSAGRLADDFNTMLARTRASIVSYNAMRDKVATMLRDIARESQAVAAASQQMASTSEQSGRAVGEIAAAVEMSPRKYSSSECA